MFVSQDSQPILFNYNPIATTMNPNPGSKFNHGLRTSNLSRRYPAHREDSFHRRVQGQVQRSDAALRGVPERGVGEEGRQLPGGALVPQGVGAQEPRGPQGPSTN